MSTDELIELLETGLEILKEEKDSIKNFTPPSMNIIITPDGIQKMKIEGTSESIILALESIVAHVLYDIHNHGIKLSDRACEWFGVATQAMFDQLKKEGKK